MKTRYPSLLLLLLYFSTPLALSAQFQFNQGWAPKAGHVSQNLLSTAPTGAIAGADQYWDFSGVTPLPGDIRFAFEYLAVASTPYANMFPNATIAAKITFQGFGDQYGYYQEDATGYYTLGSASSTATNMMEDTEKGLAYPLAFGDSYTDTYAYVTEATGLQFRTEGSMFNEYDGYGTLVLPQGTFPEVARYTQYRTERDSFGFAPGFYSIDIRLDTTIGWLSADHASPLALLQMERSYTLDYTPGQSVPDTTNVLYEVLFTYDDAAEASPINSIKTLLTSDNSLFPNPVSSILLWRNDRSSSDEVNLQIINAIGQILWTSPATKEKVQQIPVTFLDEGQFWLKISDTENLEPLRLLPFVKQ